MSDCIFCKIIEGEIPSSKVYEDDYLYVFDDINPEAAVHCLIVPKEHYVSFNDQIPENLLGKVFAAVPKIAALKGIADSGYRVVVNTGDDANQIVKHIHVHVLGGEKLD